MSMRPSMLALACLVACDHPPPPELPATDPPTAPTPVDSVDQLAALPAGFYETSGYVIAARQCPPCQGPAPCAPCPPTDLDVANQPGTKSTISLGAGDVRAFKIGARYRLTIGIDGGPDGSGRRYTVYRAVPFAGQ
jgi:hypothetical protein